MSRPKAPLMPKIEKIITEECNKFIFEIFEKPRECKYEIISNNKFGVIPYDIYRFKTDLGTSYDVDFYKILLNSNETKLITGDYLSKHINNIDIIKTIDVAFTTTNINRNTATDDEYNKRTNKNEQYEVLGKIAFIIKKYIYLHPDIFCYVVGKNTTELNLIAYKKMFENIFSSEFQILEGNNDYHNNGAYYFLKNKELK